MKKQASQKFTRRQIVTTFTIGAVAMTVSLPEKWRRPIVDMVTTPVHAAASLPATTVVPTTTALPTQPPPPPP